MGSGEIAGEVVRVELISQSGWWLPWLPVLGSVVVALVAFVGVIASNRTNRAAIDASDKRAEQDRHEARTRDFRTWQRDTTLEIASAVVQAALTAQEEYERISYDPKTDATDPASFREAARLGGVVGAATAKLMIVGAHGLASEGRALRNAMNSPEAVVAALNMNRFYAAVAAGTPLDSAREGELRSELDERMSKINSARASFGEAAEASLRQTTELPPK
ncbi:hypothetical protein [Prescottella equi]|uniref:hypothetical protein n=1 Tax=Rhodococcus hoagii TaxID=43767 RepID=UPI00111BDDE5|nr:hypothetical protein [Prescottella equi]